MNKQALAERTAEIIEREDNASRWLGMRVLEVAPGRVRMSMRVTQNMVNGQKVCHGGLIFSLADSSFGYACNSHNYKAEAQEVAHAGRTRLYDVRVTNQDGQLIAVFRGKSATVKGAWVE